MDSIITRVQHRIERGIEQTIVTDFSGAKETFRKLIEDYSDQPFGYFYLGATYQAEMLDAEQFNQLNKFSKLMEQCIRISERLRNKNGDDVWLLFYEGSAYLYRGFMDSKQKNFFEAYRNSLKGVHRLEDAIRMDSTFYDAYLGVGSFKYWKSSKAKALTWLPFISDERKLGIE
ncbi:hypothetical protein GWN91_01090, partial [Candidatus Saccharibacteria bacterium]|nr:hypothetical protein [Candidatus Saccharibacteria bacterium]